MPAGQLIRDARRADGLTQAQLARRLGVTQPSVARLERAGDEVSVRTLQRALNAMGRALVLHVREREVSYDESLLRTNLARSPAERIRAFERFHADARSLAAAGAAAHASARRSADPAPTPDRVPTRAAPA